MIIGIRLREKRLSERERESGGVERERERRRMCMS